MPKRPLSEDERRAIERDRKRRWRAGIKKRKPPALSPRLVEALDDPAASGRELARLETRIPLATRQRLDNASFALNGRVQAIVADALADALDRLEAKHNGRQPFPDPPEGFGARARSQRASQARPKKPPAST